MKVDIFTKSLLLGIFLLLALIVIKYETNMNPEEEIVIGEGSEMIIKDMGAITQLRDGKIRYCSLPLDKSLTISGWTWFDDKPRCSPWSD